jgi:hypothetical protein
MVYDGKVKYGISLSPDTAAMINKYAQTLGISRSAAISVLVTQAFEYKNVMEIAQQMPEMVKDIREAEAERRSRGRPKKK